MTRTAILVLGALLALSACNGSEGGSGAVERVAVPENACELVPADVLADWDLAEVQRSTSTRESLSFGRCLTASSADDASLDLSLTNYSGGDLDSANAFAADDRADACAELSATDAPKGTFSDTESSCTAKSTSEGVATTILISDVTESHGALRIEMSTAAAAADEAEATVNDVLAAVKESFATSG